MREFGVEATTAGFVALERPLCRLDTDAARSALRRAHRTPVALMVNEREPVLVALPVVLGDPTAAHGGRDGLVCLAAKLEHEQETAADEPPPPRRSGPTRN
jgi:hypothetical protein